MPPGHMWWTDISNQRPPDWEGNTYSRLFSEGRSHGAAKFYSPRKDSSTLIDHFDRMHVWISQHAPGGALSVVRCDFASEAARQGHGDEVYTKAISDIATRTLAFASSRSLRTPKPSTAPKTTGAASTATRSCAPAAPALAPLPGASPNAVPCTSTTTRPPLTPTTRCRTTAPGGML